MKEWLWKQLRDIAILDMCDYMNTNRDDIFSDIFSKYKIQYDRIKERGK